MELTTVIPDTMDMVTDMAALLLLIPRDRKATTVDTTVADTVTATVAQSPMIPKDRKPLRRILPSLWWLPLWRILPPLNESIVKLALCLPKTLQFCIFLVKWDSNKL